MFRNGGSRNPWQVTPALIDQVMQSIARRCVLSNLLDQVPLSGRYPARLALEQLYGYMVRNGKVYGVLTTFERMVFCPPRKLRPTIYHSNVRRLRG